MDTRIPKVGEVLVHRIRGTGREVHALVVRVSENPRSVAIEMDGKEYPSLSAAASELSGNSTNGWVYWGLKKQSTRGASQNG